MRLHGDDERAAVSRDGARDYELVVRTAGAPERRVRVSTGPHVWLGRDPECQVILEGPLVSRFHAALRIGANDVAVDDSSTNGTVAGGVKIRNSSTRIPLDGEIRIGGFTVSLAPRSAEAEGPASASVDDPQPKSPGEPRSPIVRSTPSARGQHLRALPPVPPGPEKVLDLASGKGPGVRRGPGSIGELPASPLPPPLPSSAQPGSRAHASASEAHAASPLAPLAPPAAAPIAPAPPEPPRRSEIPGAGSPAALAAVSSERDADAKLRRQAHKLLLENLDLHSFAPSKEPDPTLRPRVLTALRKVVASMSLPPSTDRDKLIGELADEALGLGPLEQFLADPAVSEIMVVDPYTIYVERMGVLSRVEARFTDDERVRAVIERIITPLGRRIDESSPFVDARLPDGSRVNAVIRPIALRGSCITIRKFSKSRISVENLIEYNALTLAMARFLQRSVVSKKNIVVAGGTGSGKTTLLNVLSEAIPEEERVVTIEDAAELKLRQPHVVSLETKPANMEGKGGHTVRDLVKNALRMRPDRIVVGECRGGEALDMLQAMNTGHDGSLTTTHANSPREAVARLETLVLMSGLELPTRAIREQIAGAVHLLVQQTRLSDGSRKVTNISEVRGIDDDGQIIIVPLFEFARTGTDPRGKVLGEFRASGFLPSFLQEFIVKGLIKPGEPYL